MKQGFVYILTNHSKTLYTGVTSQLEQRVLQHKVGIGGEFTMQYRIDKLIYFEVFKSMKRAIAREKQIKRWRRAKKVALIEKDNPAWIDLAAHLSSTRPHPSS